MSHAKRRVLRGELRRIKQREEGEAMTRFGWLVGWVLALEFLVLMFVLAQNGIFIRPLG